MNAMELTYGPILNKLLISKGIHIITLNALYSELGRPDFLWYDRVGSTCFCEYKFLHTEKYLSDLKDIVIRFEPGQQHWLDKLIFFRQNARLIVLTKYRFYIIQPECITDKQKVPGSLLDYKYYNYTEIEAMQTATIENIISDGGHR